jgi:general secretion pathway protein K
MMRVLRRIARTEQRTIITPKYGEAGAALLTVLLLVAILSVVAALMLERTSLATNLAINSADRNAARWSGFGLEAISLQRITILKQEGGRLPPVTSDDATLTWTVPLDNGAGQQGIGRIKARDAGICFNINGLVSGDNGNLSVRPLGVEQFVRLANILQIDQREAQAIAAAIADWIDSDEQPEIGGAEDGYYLRQDKPYRTGGQLIHDIAELRAVRGMNDEVYATLQPWLCALPVAELSRYNINQLRPEHYPLVASLLPASYPASRISDILRQRPEQGFTSILSFWQMVGQSQTAIRPQIQQQAVIDTRWFALDIDVQVGNSLFTEYALIDGQKRPAELVRRIWDPL